MKRLLLTTIHRPLGVTSETCGPHVVAEMFHAQLTGAQGPFSIRSILTGWNLEFLAQNLKTPTTVLHYPTLSLFIRELKKGYDYVGIAFVITGLAQISDNVGYSNMCLFTCPTIEKSSYVAATNVGIIPFMVFGPIIIGQLIDKGILSYLGSFWISLILMIIAVIYILLVVDNPKSYTEMKAAQKNA
jgi:hypothetical protein